MPLKMLVKTKNIISKVAAAAEANTDTKQQPEVIVMEPVTGEFADDKTKALIKSIGYIINGKTMHYYSYGNFNLVRLIIHLLKQTGPAHVFMTSYSFSQTSIEQLLNHRQKGNILSFRVLIDNRVKTMSPIPFQMLSTAFDYRCSSIHAKVALIWNDTWNISIVTSQNATDNPKMERGTIFTDIETFNFDKNALENEFLRGTA
jgi:hypothetical protein